MKRKVLEFLKETIDENFYLKEEIRDLQLQNSLMKLMQVKIDDLKGQLVAEKKNWVFEKQNK